MKRLVILLAVVLWFLAARTHDRHLPDVYKPIVQRNGHDYKARTGISTDPAVHADQKAEILHKSRNRDFERVARRTFGPGAVYSQANLNRQHQQRYERTIASQPNARLDYRKVVLDRLSDLRQDRVKR